MMRSSAHRDYPSSMRTTVNLDDDVTAEVERIRRERGIGLSEAVNELARAGVSQHRRGPSPTFRQRTTEVRVRINIDNVAEALELGDEHPQP